MRLDATVQPDDNGDMTQLRVPMHDGVFVDCGLFGLALRSDFPCLQLAPGMYLTAGWEAWVRFCQNTTRGERGLARAALAALDVTRVPRIGVKGQNDWPNTPATRSRA